MTKTEKAALQESVLQVGAALLINFPLQTFLLWLFIEQWGWTSAFLISLMTTFIFTVVALIRTYMIRMEIEKRRRHGLWRKVRNSGSR
ncbi:MAG: hypothetical protein CBE33_03530 [Candidatus Pelagibacter sp. TMED273]|nr:MAG: hypothetical protein CBE33_03530 [Candidatus Pelagibacter sp. TMED273]|tara:strand:+ start:2712 stop:2975 length:264 start_codon:yes stop_codon:yes gene_type:complete